VLLNSAPPSPFYESKSPKDQEEEEEEETVDQIAEKIASNTLNYFNTLSIDDNVTVWRVSKSMEIERETVSLVMSCCSGHLI